jgi:hypothetical protein
MGIIRRALPFPACGVTLRLVIVAIEWDRRCREAHHPLPNAHPSTEKGPASGEGMDEERGDGTIVYCEGLIKLR